MKVKIKLGREGREGREVAKKDKGKRKQKRAAKVKPVISEDEQSDDTEAVSDWSIHYSIRGT